MIWLKKHLFLLLSLAVAVLAGRMLLTPKHFYTHDDIQVFRLNEFIECVGRGEIPCRWSDSMGKGYGYPLFNYYPPLIYVFPSLIHLTGLTLITSLNLFMFLTFILAAWGMYNLVKSLTGRAELGFFASTLYTLYPFHATNVFIRGVYAENLAWSLVPWLFWGIHLLVKTGRSRWLPLIFASIFLSHLISSFVVVGLSVGWLLWLTYYYGQPLLHRAWQFAVHLLVGVALGAFFFIPALVEKNLVQSETLTEGYYSYYNHFVGLKQLFLDYTWVYGASYFGTPAEEMGFMVGHIHTLLLVISIVLGIYYLRQSKKIMLGLLLAIAFFALLLLSHQQSLFIYQLVPSLAYVQFPWRFIGWAGLPLVLAITYFLSHIPKNIASYVIMIGAISLVVYAHPFFAPREYDQYQDADFVSGELTPNQQVSSIYDYLPKSVEQIPEEYASDSQALIPIFYFPGWTARDQSGKMVEIGPSDPHGLITPLDNSIDPSSLTLTFRATPGRLVMDLLSLVTLGGYAIYLYKSRAYSSKSDSPSIYV